MTTYRRIGAVTTTIAVLRHLAEQREPVSAADIAKMLEIQYGTAMCHLATLEDERFVRRIGECWELGDGLAVLWARRKAQLEGNIIRSRSQLRAIGVESDV